MLRRIFYLFAALTVSANVSVSQNSTGGQPTQTDKQKESVVVPSATVLGKINLIEGKVVLVYDGDLLSIEGKDGKIYSVRLQGIDAPDEKQNYHKKARKNLADLVLNKEVKIVVHRQDLLDRYIGNVYLEGQDVSLRQLEMGMAWHFKQFSYQQTAEERRRYAQAEARARASRLGLWEDDQPVSPWNFRDGKKTAEAVVKSDVRTAPGTTETPSTPGERKYIRGPRGGCYYISASGKKNYVDHALCN